MGTGQDQGNIEAMTMAILKKTDRNQIWSKSKILEHLVQKEIPLKKKNISIFMRSTEKTVKIKITK